MNFAATLISLLILVSCSSAGPIMATGNTVGKSRGEACKRDIMFLIPISLDNSIYTAARKGKITEISTVDSSSFTTFFYNSHCTVVRGFKGEPEKEEPKVVKVRKKKSKLKKVSNAPTKLQEKLIRF